MVYLVVKDEKDHGVYAFYTKEKAIEIASHLSNYVFMKESEKEKALALLGVKEISDASVLISKYRNKQGKTPKKERDNGFTDIFRDVGRTDKDCLKITMTSGDEYVFYVRDVFYTTVADIHKKFLMPSSSGPIVNSTVVNDAVKAGRINCLRKSRIEYKGDFAMLYECDDKYSPDVDTESDNLGYKHHYEKAAINVRNVESVVPVDSQELGSYMIKNPTLLRYLNENWERGK